MVITPRMPTSRNERGPMIHLRYDLNPYEALQDLAEKDQGTALDLNCHRYKAVANRICVGYFSSLKLAFREVDRATPLWGTTWEQTEELEDRITYVQDVIGNRTFVRVPIQKRAQKA